MFNGSFITGGSLKILEGGKLKLNTGIIIFVFIFAYLVIRILISLFDKPVSITSVEKGYIVENSYYNGIIIRDEKVIEAEESGDIYFYLSSGKMAAKQEEIYLIDKKGSLKGIADSGSVLDAASVSYGDLKETISSYQNHSDSRYDEIYSLRFDLENMVNSSLTNSIMNNEEVRAAIDSSDCETYRSDDIGIVSHTFDSYSGITLDSVEPEMFDRKDFREYSLENGSAVKKGDDILRLTQNGTWYIIIRLDEAQKNALQGRSNITIRFRRDDITTGAGFSVFEKNGNYYGRIELSKYMIRYINSRFIDIELITTSEQGLKIPTSSIVTKEFYVVSPTYVLADPADGKNYVISNSGNGDKKEVTVYSRDESSCYIDKNQLQAGEELAYPNGEGNPYVVGETGSLNGVYCINRGYAVFRLIDILYQTDIYTIINENQEYGLSLYDRIVINSDEVYESQLIDKFTGED